MQSRGSKVKIKILKIIGLISFFNAKITINKYPPNKISIAQEAEISNYILNVVRNCQSKIGECQYLIYFHRIFRN